VEDLAMPAGRSRRGDLMFDHSASDLRRGRWYCAFLIDFDGNNLEAGVYG
jgi:hypothetical protein